MELKGNKLIPTPEERQIANLPLEFHVSSANSVRAYVSAQFDEMTDKYLKAITSSDPDKKVMASEILAEMELLTNVIIQINPYTFPEPGMY